MSDSNNNENNDATATTTPSTGTTGTIIPDAATTSEVPTTMDRAQVRREDHRYAVQQHMADIKLFMRELKMAKAYLKNYPGTENIDDYLASRIKFWDNRVSELRVPEQ